MSQSLTQTTSPVQQDGNRISGSVSNTGNAILGNNLWAGKDNIINIYGESSTDRLRKECLHALFLTDPTDDKSKIISFKGEVIPGTCDWLLKNSAFRQWLGYAGKSRLLWIHGPPGSGKTMLAVFLTTKLEQALPPNATLLYYFCDGTDFKRNGPIHILRGLIYSLVRQKPDLISYLLPDFEVQDTSLFNDDSLEALWRIFKNMVKSLEMVYCVVDGVDECNKTFARELKHLLMKLESFYISGSGESDTSASTDAEELQTLMLGSGMNSTSKDTQSGNVQKRSSEAAAFKVVVVSRNQSSSLRNELCTYPQINLASISQTADDQYVQSPPEVAPLENEQNGCMPSTNLISNDSTLPDISMQPTRNVGYSQGRIKYIATQVDSFLQTHQAGSNLRDILIKQLSRDNHTHLWIDMALGYLALAWPDRFADALQKLPDTVEGIYSQQLLTIPSNLHQPVLFLIRWSSMALHPLSIEELAAAYGFIMKQSSENARETIIPAISAMGTMLDRNDKDVIILAHQTIISFFTEPSSTLAKHATLNKFLVPAAEVHAEMAYTCMSYIQSGMLGSGAVNLKGDDLRLLEHRLLRYAILYWPHHLRLGYPARVDLNSPLFNSALLKVWWESCFSVQSSVAPKDAPFWFSSQSSGAFPDAPSCSALNVAAYYDILIIPQELHQQGKLTQLLEPLFDEQPLVTAARRGSLEVFKFLSACGASPLNGTKHVLSEACEAGQLEIAEYLLESGVSPGIVEEDHILTKGVRQFYRKTPGLLHFLTKTTKSEEAKDFYLVRQNDTGGNWSPILYASLRGKDEAVKLLVERGASVNSATSTGWTPLHCASWSGSESLTELLLLYGANLYATSADMLMMHHLAANRGRTEVLKVLFGKGLNTYLEVGTRQGKTALHLASKEGHKATVQYLLSAGANIEAPTLKLQTPLLVACSSGHKEIVKVLLEAGADRNARSSSGETAKQLAKRAKSPEIVTLLKQYFPVTSLFRNQNTSRLHSLSVSDLALNSFAKMPSGRSHSLPGNTSSLPASPEISSPPTGGLKISPVAGHTEDKMVVSSESQHRFPRNDSPPGITDMRPQSAAASVPNLASNSELHPLETTSLGELVTSTYDASPKKKHQASAQSLTVHESNAFSQPVASLNEPQLTVATPSFQEENPLLEPKSGFSYLSQLYSSFLPQSMSTQSKAEPKSWTKTLSEVIGYEFDDSKPVKQ